MVSGQCSGTIIYPIFHVGGFEGWELNPELPEDFASVIRSELKAWMIELEVLSRDPSVRKFAELRQKIDEADAIIDEAVAPPAPDRSSPFHPYDAYDAFEFAKDISGREVSTLQLSKLAYDRFPEWSDDSRRFMVQYLIENGVAEVAETTVSGRPTSYRFGSLRNGGIAGRRSRLGIPENELSALKADDLDDLVVGTTGRGRFAGLAKAAP